MNPAFTLFPLIVGIWAAYEMLLHSKGRAVLELLPIDGWHALLREGCSLRSFLLLILSAFAFFLLVYPQQWLYAFGFLLSVSSGFLVGLTALLGAAYVARSPSWKPVLEPLRGGNPVEQTAWIYAPGVALLISGIPTYFLVEAIVMGKTAFYPFMAFALLHLLAITFIPYLARHFWHTVSVLQREIAARVGAANVSSATTSVPFQSLFKIFPLPVRLYGLDSMRRIWRQERSWLNATLLSCIFALWNFPPLFLSTALFFGLILIFRILRDPNPPFFVPKIGVLTRGFVAFSLWFPFWIAGVAFSLQGCFP